MAFSKAFERELSYSSHNSSVTRLSAIRSSLSAILKAPPPGELLLIKILINNGAIQQVLAVGGAA
ncbi:hypothetical protein [Brasilonema bromeliae]|nr:hypothetical protein [Brasilonema bromeliae]